MKERVESEEQSRLARRITKILEEEGPCSATKITRLVNELSNNGEYNRDRVIQELEIMRRGQVISTCFYPGDPPEHLKKADVYYGFFLTRDEDKLVESGVLKQAQTYSVQEIASGEDIIDNFPFRTPKMNPNQS